MCSIGSGLVRRGYGLTIVARFVQAGIAAKSRSDRPQIACRAGSYNVRMRPVRACPAGDLPGLYGLGCREMNSLLQGEAGAGDFDVDAADPCVAGHGLVPGEGSGFDHEEGPPLRAAEHAGDATKRFGGDGCCDFAALEHAMKAAFFKWIGHPNRAVFIEADTIWRKW